MQNIRERVEIKDPNTNTRIYFEVRAIALRLRLHTEGFQLSTIGSSIQESPLRNYNLTPEYTTPSLYNTYLYTRGGTKPSTKQRKIQPGDHKDHKLHLVISKDHK